MATFNDIDYREHFLRLTGREPFAYQIDVARLLLDGRNVTLRAPTGAGKTMAVIAPFLFPHWGSPPAKLIYALPLRTLANGVFSVACEAAGKLDLPIRSGSEPFVTLQTGEQPDDPFFNRGRIIVTTYDQVLSGLLCAPYGLSDRLHNINSAALAGALVVFDEFHLMPPDKAFLTAVAGLRIFKEFCQSVWMTATATAPLEEMLRSALDTAPVPQSDNSMREMLESLPSANSVTRTLLPETQTLSADRVLECHDRRSIVLANTVARAQGLFEELHAKLSASSEVRLILLHSRFFKDDRQRKETELRATFGKDACGPAILVSTQVIEAGLDISCEHLHTELCPMNALVQRAGRCARFPGEVGTVHIYALPNTRGGWLPYGDLQAEHQALTATRTLLSETGPKRMDQALVGAWIEHVHADSDRHALRENWMARKKKALDLIVLNTIERQPAGVAHLIRGNDSESMRVIIADEQERPDSPAMRESISLRRWSLAPNVNPTNPIGWYWDADDVLPWKALTSPAQLGATYAVCLRREFAGYDGDRGLRLGTPGTVPSPERAGPRRPGYAPLREEPWTNHADMVAQETQSRLARDGFPGGLIADGFSRRYGMTADEISLTSRLCGLLHDLGKLQVAWQDWAAATQRSKDTSYEPTVPLAHTDFDPDDPSDRECQRAVGKRRPPHASCSAYYCISVLESALRSVAEDRRAALTSAAIAAVLAHHGAFVPRSEGLDLGILPLIAGWEKRVEEIGLESDSDVNTLLTKESDKKGLLIAALNVTTMAGAIERWWPLVSYLMRTLRLSDQRATSEWACRE